MDDFQKNALRPTFLICAAVILTCLLTLFESSSFGAGRVTNAVSKTRPTLDVCTHHPELFHVRALTASEGMRLIRPTGEVLAIPRFGNGEVVSGGCTRFIKSFSYGVILSNGARFGMKDLAFVPAPPAAPGAGLPHSLFVPPPNVRSIAADKFAEGKGRTMVYHFSSVLLWSGPTGSAIGTLRCAPLDTYPCTLGKQILSSPYRIHQFGIMPAPDPESESGSIWMWITIAHGQEAIVSYDTLSK